MNTPSADDPSSPQHYSKCVTGNKNCYLKLRKPEIKLVSSVTYPDTLYAKTICYFAFVKKILKKINQ